MGLFLGRVCKLLLVQAHGCSCEVSVKCALCFILSIRFANKATISKYVFKAAVACAWGILLFRPLHAKLSEFNLRRN